MPLKYTFKPKEKEPSEVSEEEPSEEVADPLADVNDVDEVQDIAQEIFDAAYKANRKYAKSPSRFPPKTHVYIRLMNENTKSKEWVPLVTGKDNKASDIALEEVMNALNKHNFKVSYRAETVY